MDNGPQALARYLALFPSPETLDQEVRGKSDKGHIYDLTLLRDRIQHADANLIKEAMGTSLSRCLLSLLDLAVEQEKVQLVSETVKVMCEILKKTQPVHFDILGDIPEVALTAVETVDVFVLNTIVRHTRFMFETISERVPRLPSGQGAPSTKRQRTSRRESCKILHEEDRRLKYSQQVKANLKTEQVSLACAVLKNLFDVENSLEVMEEYLPTVTKELGCLDGSKKTFPLPECRRHSLELLKVIKEFTSEIAPAVLEKLEDRDLLTLRRTLSWSECSRLTRCIVTNLLAACEERDITRLRRYNLVWGLLPTLQDLEIKELNQMTSAIRNCFTKPDAVQWFLPNVVISDIRGLLALGLTGSLYSYLQWFRHAVGKDELDRRLQEIYSDERFNRMLELEPVFPE